MAMTFRDFLIQEHIYREAVQKYNHNHDERGRFATTSRAGGQHKPHMKGQELVEYTMKELGISQQEAKDMIREISGYTDGYATDMRTWQQGGSRFDMQEMTPSEAKRMSDQVERYIDLAPKWGDGDIYRGVGVDDVTAGRILDEIYSDKPISMMGTSSWTSDRSIAEDFSELPSADIAIIFHAPGTQKGTSIDHISDFSQSEVLVSKEARWKVKQFEGGIDDGYMIVDLEELP